VRLSVRKGWIAFEILNVLSFCTRFFSVVLNWVEFCLISFSCSFVFYLCVLGTVVSVTFFLKSLDRRLFFFPRVSIEVSMSLGMSGWNKGNSHRGLSCQLFLCPPFLLVVLVVCIGSPYKVEFGNQCVIFLNFFVLIIILLIII
jgi:hypothetical protein